MIHEPPRLSGINERGMERCIPNNVCRQYGIVFQHLSYVFEHQIAFKAEFYGYGQSAIDGWRRLQNHKGPWPVNLKPFLGWVSGDPLVHPLF